MKSFTYEALPGRVLFGVGTIEQLPEELDRLGARRVLLISGKSEQAIAHAMKGRLGDRCAGWFTGVRAHVPIEVAESARRLAREVACDSIVTIGGGSSTGLGKAVVLDRAVPLIAVPTTYAGSELTPIYGITVKARKQTGRDLRVLPSVVIYDPALTVSLPPAVTAASGMNALAHCVEALYSAQANPLTSLVAEEGIRAIAGGLPVAVREPQDIQRRSQVLYGALLAGVALAAVSMGIHHRICHVLGGTYGLSHGDANAVILPHAVRYNAEAAPDVMSRIATALGTADAATGIFDLAVGMGAPTSLRALGMPEARLEEAAALAADRAPPNPRPVDVPSLLALLQDAYDGRRPVAGPPALARVT